MFIGMRRRPQVKVGTRVTGHRRTLRHHAAAIKRAQSFAPAYRWARREMIRWNASNFATLGEASGKPWNALDTEYQAWKIAHHGAVPTMIRTGDLYRDLITLRGGPNHIGHKSAAFGTNIEYAHFHQTGTRHMPQREIVFVPKRFAESLGEKMAEHVVEGNVVAAGYKKAKHLLFNPTNL